MPVSGRGDFGAVTVDCFGRWRLLRNESGDPRVAGERERWEGEVARGEWRQEEPRGCSEIRMKMLGWWGQPRRVKTGEGAQCSSVSRLRTSRPSSATN